MGKVSSNEQEYEYERLFGSESPGTLRIDLAGLQERFTVEGQIAEISVEKEEGWISVKFKPQDLESREEQEALLFFSFDVAGVLGHSILAAASMGNNAEPPSANPNKFVFKTLIGPPDTKV